MSFGVGVGDIIAVIKIAKNIVEDCRYAPSEFAEASRVSQTLYLMLEGVKTEFENPDSPLCKDDRTRTDFAIHLKNCETSLKPLADLIAKHKRLAGSNVRVLDRMRFPKKEYLKYRGDLAFYTASLSEFLQIVGLGSLGRIEQNVEDINEYLPNLMNKLDQMCAEFRIMGDKESLLSDHTDDEKFVWKTFRSKLNEAGFTSKVLREHEGAIFLRIRELTECGLLDEADRSCSPCWDNEALRCPTRIHQMPFRSPTMMAFVESDTESEKTSTPKPSFKDLQPETSAGARQPSRVTASELKQPEQKSNIRRESLSRKPSLAQADTKHESVPPAHFGASSDKPRIWRNPLGEALLKGKLSDSFFRKGQPFVTIVDTDKQEVWIPLSNLSQADLEYVDVAQGEPPDDMQHVRVQREERAQNKESSQRSSPSPDKSKVAHNLEGESVDLPRRTRPENLVGKRTRPEIKWTFREEGSELPQVAPYCPRSSLTSDLLPMAASKGDLSRVRKLLVRQEHIESKGPQSWTETIDNGYDGYGNKMTTTRRHSYPETTALYRAAQAGWFDIVRYLIGHGADVNTRNGYNGGVGHPILFVVISNGQEKMARLLLEYGAQMEAFGPTTALHVASSHPKRTLVRLALDYGANIDAKDGLNRTPLYLAGHAGFASIVRLLLEEGARTDTVVSGGQSVLYKASGQGRQEVVDLLLRYGADPAVGRGRFGETTMYKAAWYNQLEIVELLLNFEADVNIRNKKKIKSYKGVGEKILHGLVAGLSKDHAIMNTWGKTALHAAAYQGHEEVVQLLLQAGADLEATGNDGLTPMYLAAQRKHGVIVQMFLKAGAQLETERHDPVLALLSERNEAKDDGKSREMIKKDDHRREMAKMGTSDALVGLVADWTKTLSSSRRLQDHSRNKKGI